MNINLLSYNIHKGYTLGNTRYVLPEIKRQLRKTDADLVFLQEVKANHPGFEQRFEHGTQYNYLAQGQWAHTAYGQNVNRRGGHGNALLSRLPIISSRNIDLSMRALEKRGLLHCVLDTGGDKPLHALCTHLNLREKDRAQQCYWITEYINAHIPRDEPIVMGGDFNDWRGQLCQTLREACSLQNPHLEQLGAAAKTFPSHRPVLALDRLYTRGVSVARQSLSQQATWAGLSDHSPLSASVQLSLAAKAPAQEVAYQPTAIAA